MSGSRSTRVTQPTYEICCNRTWSYVPCSFDSCHVLCFIGYFEVVRAHVVLNVIFKAIGLEKQSLQLGKLHPGTDLDWHFPWLRRAEAQQLRWADSCDLWNIAFLSLIFLSLSSSPRTHDSFSECILPSPLSMGDFIYVTPIPGSIWPPLDNIWPSIAKKEVLSLLLNESVRPRKSMRPRGTALIQLSFHTHHYCWACFSFEHQHSPVRPPERHHHHLPFLHSSIIMCH